MTTLKSCLLCSSECPELNTSTPNVYKVCRKLLHSTLVTKFGDKNKCLVICEQCLESAKQLVNLSDQMKSIQKQVSDFVLTFSLEILNRRRKTTEKDSTPRKRAIEMDVSNLPHCDPWICTPTPEDIEKDLLLVPYPYLFENEMSNEITVEEFKSENYLDGWASEEGYDKDNPDFPSLDLPNNIKIEVQNSSSFMTHEKSGMLKLQRLQFQSEEREIIAETRNKDDSEKRGTSKTIWSKTDRDSYKMVTETTEESNRKRFPSNNGKEISIHQNSSVSSELPSSSSTSLSSNFKVALTTEKSETSNQAPSRNFTKPNLKKKPTHAHSKIFALFRNGKNNLSRNLFQCNYCEKTFKHQRALSIHKTKHHLDKLNGCDICNKKFSDKYSAERHRKNHSEDKANKCSLCTKSFVKPCDLKYHCQMKHAEEKPFICAYCSKGFVRKGRFVAHVRMHTGEKPFKCDQCNYATTYDLNLRLHKMSNHSNWKFKCRECGKIFSLPKLVREHYKRAHHTLEMTDDCVIKIDRQSVN